MIQKNVDENRPKIQESEEQWTTDLKILATISYLNFLNSNKNYIPEDFRF